MKTIKNNWLIIVLLILSGGNLIQYLNPVIKIESTVTRDTTTVIDSSSINELKLVKSRNIFLAKLLEGAEKKLLTRITEIDTSKGYIVVNHTDALLVDSSLTEQSYVAILDTVSNRDSIRVEYFHPFGIWNFRHKDFTTKTYINTKTIVEKKPLFDFSHGIIAGAIVTQNGTVQFGFGYGFKLGINL